MEFFHVSTVTVGQLTFCSDQTSWTCPLKRVSFRDIPGGPVAKAALLMQGARVPSLIKELDTRVTTKDHSCCNQDLAQPNKYVF